MPIIMKQVNIIDNAKNDSNEIWKFSKNKLIIK